MYVDSSFLIEFDSKKNNFSFSFSNIYPEPYTKVSHGSKVIVLGSPILKGRVNRKQVANEFAKFNKSVKASALDLDGEFLIIIHNISKGSIEVINDRYTSIPLYFYYDDQKFIASNKYLSVARKLKTLNKFVVDGDNFFQFLWFRRLYDESTYDKKSRFLKAARIISIDSSKQNIDQYWKPSFKKSNDSLKSSAIDLADLIVDSLNKKTSDIEQLNKVGLFLSGGMDTRTILAAILKQDLFKPTCYTLGYSKLGEYRVAKQLTKSANLNHFFLKIPQDYYDKNWEAKNEIASGMYNHLNNIFLGHDEIINKNSNIFFHGHGLDFMFQGMYLPTKVVNLFGKKTHFKKIIDLNKIDDFTEFFIFNSPYRMWRVDVGQFVKKQYFRDLYDRMFSTIKNIEQEGKELSNDNFDLWEYILTHTISRHYSQTDVMGMATYGDQRKVANDNQLFDFYLSMSLDKRKYARVMKKTLNYLNNDFAKIISANTGCRIDSSPLNLTFEFALKKFLSKFNPRYRLPTASDRTWPDEDQQIRSLQNLNRTIRKIHKSDYLHEYMPYMDFKKLEIMANKWLDGNKANGGQFLMCLLSIEEFLKSL